MIRANHLAGLLAAVLSTLLAGSEALAKRTGMNLPCNNCHEGQTKPKVTAALSVARLEAGQPVTITVTASHPTATVGGVLIDSGGIGAFEMIDPVGTHLFEGMPTLATHAMPQMYVGGQVQFSFNWVAPAMVGVVDFDIWSNAGNDNMDPHDDHAAGIATAVSVGCDALWYYLDADLDGAGEEATRLYSCEPMPGRIVQGGDCDDRNPSANASMPEICNSIDDNCDGVVDEGFTPVLLVEDSDGDGYGSRGGMTKIGCPPQPGFAPSFDDCDDGNAAINPGATEVANGRDDDCNGRVDDLASTPGGPGSPGAAPTQGEDASCRLGPAAPGSAPLLLVTLLAGYLRRRFRA